MRETPAAASMSRRASKAGVPTPAARRRSRAAVQEETSVALTLRVPSAIGRSRLFLRECGELGGLVLRCKRIDDRIEAGTVQHFGQIVDGEVDAMIRHA